MWGPITDLLHQGLVGGQWVEGQEGEQRRALAELLLQQAALGPMGAEPL